MKNLKETKVENNGDSNYTKWLNNLVGERKLFSELTEDEVYKIILRVSEITFSRNPVLSQDHTFEDAAGIIYRNFFSRDFEKNWDIVSDTQGKKYKVYDDKLDKFVEKFEFPFYDEKSGKYFKEWRPRTECKGFKRMKESSLTIQHFSNMMFQELRNHISWHTRNVKFQNIHNNSISLDYENDDNVKMIEKIADTNNTFKEVEDDINLNLLSDMVDDNINEDYVIKFGREERVLSYGNLLYLYSYLANGKRISSGEIIKHIKYKENEELSQDNVRYIGGFISSFKKFLLETGIVNTSTYMNKGKEKIRYGFAEQLY